MKKVPGGFKVVTSSGPHKGHVHSKRPLSKAKASAQIRAIYASERRSRSPMLSGGRLFKRNKEHSSVHKILNYMRTVTEESQRKRFFFNHFDNGDPPRLGDVGVNMKNEPIFSYQQALDDLENWYEHLYSLYARWGDKRPESFRAEIIKAYNGIHNTRNDSVLKDKDVEDILYEKFLKRPSRRIFWTSGAGFGHTTGPEGAGYY